ncbi:aldehyde dehydrogenase family protein [Dactylosporangium aurantiacum]|uniref:Aldehyde dehydrogenase n=1 Tax=Dactylosporangium aurantiacum TaxID=35754 RepID=A0A9Q9IHV8_9ACTN|nr:aldehyde dehydrogenase family protein [Dactylosporangium aurantiacum]MDG6106058.1 aldehyde dehydrogenase family protein [Dactylosporangium aurantiacum]UWZ55896.1 aldehyde dehydrogenase family protein [Dactylosporangium aurantiacum]
MTATRTPGVPAIDEGSLISTSPASGDEIGRFPVASPDHVTDAVARARDAAGWWAGLGFAGRRKRLLAFRSVLTNRLEELAELMHREGGKPIADALVEAIGAIDHIAWAANHARKVLGRRRVGSSVLLAEHTSYLEYLPFGVIGVIGPWNYPVLTPMGSIAYALAAGNAVVFKPSEYTPAVGQWIVDRFAEVVPERPVLQIVHGMGDVGGALCRSGVDKIAFTGSTATGKKVMAAAAESLTPVLLECGGKDAMIVAADADLDAAADACVWGGLTNAGQTCVGIERVYVADGVYDAFLGRVVARAAKLTVGEEGTADVGPITMPSQIDVIRRHIEDALTRGGRAVLGGAEAVRPPFVSPTILVDVPEDAAAVQEETFGPTLTIARVKDADEAVRLANGTGYGLGGAIFSKSRGLELARGVRSGMTSINSALTFAGMPSLPFGGVGGSGFGRIHGEDGLREFTRAKAIVKRRGPSLLAITTFDRAPKTMRQVLKIVKLVHGRSK